PPAGLGLARHHRRWAVHPRGGVLPRQLRCLAGGDDRRQALRARHAREARAAAGAAPGDPMSVRVFISRDAAALSLGADETAAALAAAAAARMRDVTLVRTGSRGM